MVKIEEKSLEERAAEELARSLIFITNEIISTELGELQRAELEIWSSSSAIFISDKGSFTKTNIDILPHRRKMFVNNPNYLNVGMRLAERYERELGGEFTIKKEY